MNKTVYDFTAHALTTLADPQRPESEADQQAREEARTAIRRARVQARTVGAALAMARDILLDNRERNGIPARERALAAITQAMADLGGAS